MLRKSLAVCLVLSAALTGTLSAAGPFFGDEPPGISGVPYSGVSQTKSTTVFSDGNRIVRTNTVRYFRDGQGRTRTERSSAAVGEGSPTQPGVLIIISDPVSGERFILHPQNKTVDVLQMRGGVAAPATVTPPLDSTAPYALLGLGMGIGATPVTEATAATTSLGQKVVNGLTATGTRVVRTIPSGVLGNERSITSTLDQWLSTDLGVPVQITEKSSIGGQVTFNLEQVVRAEPDPSLFSPPSTYTRRQINPSVAATVMSSAEAAPVTNH
jgi:hypothetical protein